MPSRRKLIEQVITRTTGLGQRFSAGATTAHVSAVVDRRGFWSAHVIGTTFSLSTAETMPYVFTLKHSDLTDAATFSAFNTATFSVTVTGALSTDATLSSKSIDLLGASRYLQVTVSTSAATTITAIVTSAIVLGDGVNEPSV